MSVLYNSFKRVPPGVQGMGSFRASRFTGSLAGFSLWSYAEAKGSFGALFRVCLGPRHGFPTWHSDAGGSDGHDCAASGDGVFLVFRRGWLRMSLGEMAACSWSQIGSETTGSRRCSVAGTLASNWFQITPRRFFLMRASEDLLIPY